MRKFTEVFEEMNKILDKDVVTVQDYNDFMDIPISNKYTQDQQEQLGWLVEGMQIRSADIKSKVRSFLKDL
tara:strand:+ start:2889 stop:3101 length:213 start_codon:yes stop_codon:yes gene_type:complete